MMVKPVFLAMFLLLLNAGTTLGAAGKPLASSCSLVQALISKGGDGGVSQMISQVQHWPSDKRAQLRALMAPQVSQFSYLSGEVYLVADFGEFMQEHLVVVEAAAVGTAYFRIVYEKFDGELSLAWITFQGAYTEISKLAFAQVPRKLSCG